MDGPKTPFLSLTLSTLDFAAGAAAMKFYFAAARRRTKQIFILGVAKLTVARVLKSLGLALLPHLFLFKLLLLIDPKCLLCQRCFLLFQQNHVHWFVHVRRSLAAGAAARAVLC